MSDTDVFGQIGAAAATARGNDEYWSKKRDDTKAEEARAAVYDSTNNEIPGSTAIAAPGAPAVGGVHGALNSVAHHIEAFAKKLWDGGLNDAHVPNSQQAVAAPPSTPVPSSPDASAPPAGIPSAGAGASPAPPPVAGAPSPGATTPGASSPAIPTGLATAPPQVQKAAVAAVTDPASNQGKPQAPPPHSMSHYDYDHMDKLAYTAAAAAERAGQDGAKVLESLHTVRTSFIQSGILKNITAANAALMIGDQKSLEQAMKNVNYYLPNGQDLEMHKGPDGVLQYRDPFAPPGADGQQPWVDVTTQHIQLMSQNAMDPTKVQGIINDARLQGAKIAHEQSQDKALLLTAQGHADTGKSRLQDSGTRAGLAGSQKYRNIGMTDAALRAANAAALRASTAGLTKGTVPFAVAAKASAEGTKAFTDIAQGLQEIEPTKNPDGSINYSPAAGRSFRNPDKIPLWARDLKPTDLAGAAALSGNILAANVGRMSPLDAASLAGRAYKLSHGTMTTHKGPDGSPQNDFKISQDGTKGQIWEPGQAPGTGNWRVFNMQPEVGNAFATGADQSIQLPEGAEDAGGDNYDAEDAADNAPAIEPPAQ